ncbi:MAG TPA: L-2-hydroxyglutarate oxidase [Candidatus Limnocylindrales bacterium]|nr:L-2-hydroxyglutarate oxidase [Candidatus Limnocylindrales bacterium]
MPGPGSYDVAVVGGGIVGLATVLALRRRRPDAAIVLVEKEDRVATHQTGHNSGVIHAGVYYAPGSLKARLCRAGAVATKDFCRASGIRFEEPGKLLVATDPLELRRMEELERRVHANEIPVERLSGGQLHELEPEVRGLGALLVRSTGIVSYSEVAAALATRAAADGTTIRFGGEVVAIREDVDGVSIETAGETYRAARLVACAGLQADRVARLAGMAIREQIIPFRGEYFALAPARRSIVRHLVYPIPDPGLPFLGIHVTPLVDGTITVGPNAVLGFAREGYRRGSVSARDLTAMVTYPGFWRTVGRHWRSGLRELRNSIFRRGYLAECRRYCPSLRLEDLVPYPAGIRAQAVRRDGTLVEDFLFAQTDRMLHVINAPSPAATSALPIGELIADRLLGADAGSPILTG